VTNVVGDENKGTATVEQMTDSTDSRQRIFLTSVTAGSKNMEDYSLTQTGTSGTDYYIIGDISFSSGTKNKVDIEYSEGSTGTITIRDSSGTTTVVDLSKTSDKKTVVNLGSGNKVTLKAR